MVPSPPKVVTRSTFRARGEGMEDGPELVLWMRKGRSSCSEAASSGSRIKEMLG